VLTVLTRAILADSGTVGSDLPGWFAPAVRSGSPMRLCSTSTFREFLVASVCDVCGKGPGFGMSVSHSHRRTPRRWNPNIQTVHAVVGKTPKRLNVCTSCLKAGKVTRA
jgi:large subunit ribosomal protein L28